jgi:hypothetical protein
MHSRLCLAFGTAAWLITANLASADEIGTGMDKANIDTQSNVSSGEEDSMPTDISNGVEYRRSDRSGDSSRTGRSDQSSVGARGQSDSTGGGESGEGSGGEGGGGEGGGAVD